MQSYRLSNFENDWHQVGVEPGPRGSPRAGRQTFLRPPTLTANNFKALGLTDPLFLALKDLILFPN